MRLFHWLVLLTVAALLAGCATTEQIRTITHEVKIPIPCDPQLPAKPASAVDTLPLDAQVDEQMRALRADRQRSNAYQSQLEKALAACR